MGKGDQRSRVKPPDLGEVADALDGADRVADLHGHTCVSGGKVRLEWILKIAEKLAAEQKTALK